MAAHSLTIGDRGLGHVHRWAPTCSCGWIGVFRRHPRDASKLYRRHLNGYQSARHTGMAGQRPVRRQLTPVSLLPEALR